jgi:pimeloyl-ACP methyl ester carboxylesterase
MPKINRDGIEIYYEVHGSGPPLLLTHGYSSTSQMWQGQIEALSQQHKLVLWDMRGHGRSDYPDDPSAYSETLTVADMAALLDEVGADSAIVGGLSLGGYMSLAFYRAHPERVRTLLIIDTGARTTPATASSARVLRFSNQAAASVPKSVTAMPWAWRGPRAAC